LKPAEVANLVRISPSTTMIPMESQQLIPHAAGVFPSGADSVTTTLSKKGPIVDTECRGEELKRPG
jgi:hypothetical protein